MYNRIVVPVDFSSLSRCALTHALELARNTGAKLTVLYVKQISLLYYSALGPEGQNIPFDKPDHTDSLNLLLTDMGIPPDSIDKRIASGNPAVLIISVAAEERANLIVMGSRDFGLLTGLLLGNVSQFVIKHAPCPVLIVK